MLRTDTHKSPKIAPCATSTPVGAQWARLLKIRKQSTQALDIVRPGPWINATVEVSLLHRVSSFECSSGHITLEAAQPGFRYTRRVSYAYSSYVGGTVLVTFGANKLPRVLANDAGSEFPLRLVAAIATLDSVGETSVALAIHRGFVHPRDARDHAQPDAEETTVDFDPPTDTTVGSDSLISMDYVEDDSVFGDEEEE